MWQILLYSERQMYSKWQNGFQYGTSSCTAAGKTACTAKGRVAFNEGGLSSNVKADTLPSPSWNMQQMYFGNKVSRASY